MRWHESQEAAVRKVMRTSFIFVLAAGMLLCLVPGASATPTTPNIPPTPALAVGICTGNTAGVTVDALHIIWLGGNATSGCIQTGSPTDIVYTGATLLPGAQGVVQDLTLGVTVLPLSDFMTFLVSGATLHLDLATLGPGPLSTACPNSVDINGQSCAVYPGSVFKLSPSGSGTDVVLPVNAPINGVFPAAGLMRDSTGAVLWSGQFSATFPGVTPLQLQNQICPGHVLPCGGGTSVTSTYSGSFQIFAIPIPEPASASLLVVGALMVGIGLLRRRDAR